MKWQAMMLSTSCLRMVKFLPSNVLWLLNLLIYGNRILKMILNEDLPYFLSICGCQCRVWYRGQPIQCFVCRELGHRAQSCPLSGRCRYCYQVGRMARECAQAWDPPPPAVVSTDIPVDDSSMSDSAVVEDDRVPETYPVDNSPDPEPSADLPVDNPPDPEPSADLPDPVKVPLSAGPDSEKLPTADPVPVKVSDKLRADNYVSMSRVSKASGSSVTAKVFCPRLSKTFDHIPFPNFNVTGKEWDSKAKAHLRLQNKTVFSAKETDITNSDLQKWSEVDLRDVSNIFCEMSSVRDNLVDFVFGLFKSYWNNVKRTKGASTSTS